jgi:predicted DNA-binding protein
MYTFLFHKGAAGVLRTQIYLEDEQKARLEAIARSRSVSMADVVREAVSEYLAKNEADHRSAVVRETFGAVSEWGDRDGVDLVREIRGQWRRPSAEPGDRASEGRKPR